MRLQQLSVGSVTKAAILLARETEVSLSQCRETISRAIGYKDYFDFSRSGPRKAAENFLPEHQHAEFEIATNVQISHELDIGPVAVQHILANTLFRSARKPDMKHALQVISQTFERTALPPAGRRQSGQIGKLKSPGRNGEHVILREFGRPTRVITHQSADATVADFEYVGPRETLPLFIPMRLYIPYGIWNEQDGGRVLFSRDYYPMWRLREGKMPERMKPWGRIDFVEQTWILPEGEMPWYNLKNFDFCIQFLENEGIRSFPIPLEALPLIVQDPSIGDFSHMAKVLEARSKKVVAN